jgi:molecular chaperone DnaK
VTAPETGTDPSDPFAEDDPLDGVVAESPAPADPGGTEFDDDFDALGFDTGFGMDPGGIGDDDDTPPGGIFIGEDVSVLDARIVGRALAEAEGRIEDNKVPDMGELARGLVGIDVGAAIAVVARFTEDGTHEIVPNEDDELLTPVQVFFDDDGEKLVGKEAREMAPSQPGRAVIDVKEALSDADFSLETEEHGSLTAKDVVTLLISRLLDDVEAHAGERPTHVALASPAWYGDEQRELLREAVAGAGAELVGVAGESLAAAVPYSLRLPDLNPRTALVFDLGHAALSVAVVRCAAGDIQVLAERADRALGSHAYDDLIAAEAARKFEQQHGHDPLAHPEAALDLRLRAEEAKKSLSQRAQCTVVVSSEGQSLKVGFTRKGFEKASNVLLEKSRKLMQRVRAEGGIDSWKDLDAVIVTGGGSRMPAVRRLLAGETEKELERGLSPEDGVAVGSLYWGIGERHRQSSS